MFVHAVVAALVGTSDCDACLHCDLDVEMIVPLMKWIIITILKWHSLFWFEITILTILFVFFWIRQKYVFLMHSVEETPYNVCDEQMMHTQC